MTPDERARLAAMFLGYADREFRGSSAGYDVLARACAGEPELARPLLAAPPGQRRALLYFAAVQYLLRQAARRGGPVEPLAAWYPALGGGRTPDQALVRAFAEFVTRHAEVLGELCATRTTQTNEARRAALILPALGRVARAFPGRPVTVIEVGTSAGLLLLADRYGYEYTDATGVVVRAGRPDAPDALVMRCALRGAVPDGLGEQPQLAGRIGLDLHPVAADDPDAVDWLRSCVWPEHLDRLARLDAALAEARAVGPRLVAVDLLDGLPAALDAVDGLPVVLASNTLTYLPDAAHGELVALLHATGRRRDLAVVLNQAVRCGAALFAGVPEPPDTVTAPTVVTWADGRPQIEVLGYAAAHGLWLDWRPACYPYAPPAVRPEPVRFRAPPPPPDKALG